MLYPVATWKHGFNKHKVRGPKEPPSPIVDKHVEFDDGKNCHGFVAYRFESGVIKKFYWTYTQKGRVITLAHDVPTKPFGIWRRYACKNIIVERELYMLLKREDVLTQKELERIFLRFD